MVASGVISIARDTSHVSHPAARRRGVVRAAPVAPPPPRAAAALSERERASSSSRARASGSDASILRPRLPEPSPGQPRSKTRHAGHGAWFARITGGTPHTFTSNVVRVAPNNDAPTKAPAAGSRSPPLSKLGAVGRLSRTKARGAPSVEEEEGRSSPGRLLSFETSLFSRRSRRRTAALARASPSDPYGGQSKLDSGSRRSSRKNTAVSLGAASTVGEVSSSRGSGRSSGRDAARASFGAPPRGANPPPASAATHAGTSSGPARCANVAGASSADPPARGGGSRVARSTAVQSTAGAAARLGRDDDASAAPFAYPHAPPSVASPRATRGAGEDPGRVPGNPPRPRSARHAVVAIVAATPPRRRLLLPEDSSSSGRPPPRGGSTRPSSAATAARIDAESPPRSGARSDRVDAIEPSSASPNGEARRWLRRETENARVQGENFERARVY